MRRKNNRNVVEVVARWGEKWKCGHRGGGGRKKIFGGGISKGRGKTIERW